MTWIHRFLGSVETVRSSVVQRSPDKIEQGVESFNSQVLPAVKGVAGYKAAFLLADRQTGKGIGITLWDSEVARRRGGEAVDVARSATIKTMGGTVPPVEEFEGRRFRSLDLYVAARSSEVERLLHKGQDNVEPQHRPPDNHAGKRADSDFHRRSAYSGSRDMDEKGVLGP